MTQTPFYTIKPKEDGTFDVVAKTGKVLTNCPTKERAMDSAENRERFRRRISDWAEAKEN